VCEDSFLPITVSSEVADHDITMRTTQLTAVDHSVTTAIDMTVDDNNDDCMNDDYYHNDKQPTDTASINNHNDHHHIREETMSEEWRILYRNAIFMRHLTRYHLPDILSTVRDETLFANSVYFYLMLAPCSTTDQQQQLVMIRDYAIELIFAAGGIVSVSLTDYVTVILLLSVSGSVSDSVSAIYSGISVSHTVSNGQSHSHTPSHPMSQQTLPDLLQQGFSIDQQELLIQLIRKHGQRIQIVNFYWLLNTCFDESLCESLLASL
jgi:hypothetical protein